MNIDKESNKFTFGFAAIMVIIVASLLSIASLTLKPFQQENERQEKMQNILKAIRVDCSRQEASDIYAKYVIKEVILDGSGKEKAKGVISAFDVDTKKEFRSLAFEERNYPLFICKKNDSLFYVIPMVGKGLWGPIWGYVALERDLNTVYGAIFDHKAETPGLGAEINEGWFQEPFRGDKILGNNGEFVSIKVMKGGADQRDLHAVDAITGGTITSNGVSEMLKRTLNVYHGYDIK